MTENCVFVRYFAKFPPTRTQNFLRRGGGVVAPWPSPGATHASNIFDMAKLTNISLSTKSQLFGK